MKKFPVESIIVLGVGIGGVVTSRLHNNNSFWSKQIGSTPFRYANLPIGYMLMNGIAQVMPNRQLSYAACAIGLGMGISAVGWAFVDPVK